MANKVERERDAKNSKSLESCKVDWKASPEAAIASEAAAMVKYLLGVENALAGPLEAAVHLQMGRALNSVGANLLEGLGRTDRQAHLGFVKVARGSALEAAYHASCVCKLEVETHELARKVTEYLAQLLREDCKDPN